MTQENKLKFKKEKKKNVTKVLIIFAINNNGITILQTENS